GWSPFASLQGQTPEAERRREGGTLNVECPYKAQTEDWHAKYWCLVTNTGCKELARIYQYGERATDRRVKMKDDRTLTVTKRKLQTWDTGVYWCALGPQEEMCKVLVTTSSEPPGGQSTAREGSVRIQDDTQQGIVTITMEQLQVQDSGVYWCALQESSGLSRMEEVTLSVSKGGYGSVRTQSEIPDSFPCSLPLHCPAYPTSHLAYVCLPTPYSFGPSHGHHPVE
uniref:Immunoglobulin domain-containing protein n=1 Tax=Corvus moneduloides TaxID=1196302 RepID=A0A8C3ET75_CORMO